MVFPEPGAPTIRMALGSGTLGEVAEDVFILGV